jgi:circadian clock protein KaiC
MKSFKWNVTKLEQQNLLKVYRMGMIDPKDFGTRFKEEIKHIKEMAQEMNAKRLVVDSTTAFAMWMGTDEKIRHSLFRLSEELKEIKVTTILTSETMGGRDQYSRFGVEEFIADGVISLYFMPPQRAMFVRKMRGTKHDPKVHPFTIAQNGIEVFPKEEILWESLNR